MGGRGEKERKRGEGEREKAGEKGRKERGSVCRGGKKGREKKEEGMENV